MGAFAVWDQSLGLLTKVGRAFGHLSFRFVVLEWVRSSGGPSFKFSGALEAILITREYAISPTLGIESNDSRYGICALLGLFSIPLQYCIYENAQLFVLAFLALNSASSVVIIEYLNVDYLGNTAFDSPALRAGKYMVSLGVALSIVITFQLFVLRNPARRTLRRALGALVFSNLAYNTILQAYVRAVMPADPKRRGRPAVLKRVERELKHREAKMQMQIIETGSLMA